MYYHVYVWNNRAKVKHIAAWLYLELWADKAVYFKRFLYKEVRADRHAIPYPVIMPKWNTNVSLFGTTKNAELRCTRLATRKYKHCFAFVAYCVIPPQIKGAGAHGLVLNGSQSLVHLWHTWIKWLDESVKTLLGTLWLHSWGWPLRHLQHAGSVQLYSFVYIK